MSPTHLFVYGTLRRAVAGRFAQKALADAAYLGPARMPGRLYLVGDHYPGLIPGADGTVHGELYRLPNSALLTELDEYEGCSPGDAEPHEFVRASGAVTTGSGETVDAWYYRYNWPVQDEQMIRSGDFISEQEKL